MRESMMMIRRRHRRQTTVLHRREDLMEAKAETKMARVNVGPEGEMDTWRETRMMKMLYLSAERVLESHFVNRGEGM